MNTRNRKGIALGVVLMAIFVITLLILGAYFANIQEYRLGSNSLLQTRAMSSADYGHAVVYQTWDKSWNAFKNGTTFVRAYTPGDGAIDTVDVRLVDHRTHLARGIARRADANGGDALGELRTQGIGDAALHEHA